MIAGRWESAVVVPAAVSINATTTGVGGGGPTAVALTAATYSGISALCAHLEARLDAVRLPANWTVTLSTLTGQVSIVWTGAAATTYSIDWTATAGGTQLRDILGFTGNLTTIAQGVASVGTKQARGLWLPDCPIQIATDPRAALSHSDRRTVVTPSGTAFTHAGNRFYRIKALQYFGVGKERVLEGAAIAAGNLANSSLETFWTETQLGFTSYSAWFSPGSKNIIVDDSSTALGSYGSIAGWYVAEPQELPDMLTFITDQWTGRYRVMIGDLTSDG